MKFVDDWGSSIRNPASPAGSKPWSVAEQTKMVDQVEGGKGDGFICLLRA